jgi:hypothetical protein
VSGSERYRVAQSGTVETSGKVAQSEWQTENSTEWQRIVEISTEHRIRVADSGRE